MVIRCEREWLTYFLVNDDYRAHDWQIEEETSDCAGEKIARCTDYHVMFDLVAAPAKV